MVYNLIICIMCENQYSVFWLTKIKKITRDVGRLLNLILYYIIHRNIHILESILWLIISKTRLLMLNGFQWPHVYFTLVKNIPSSYVLISIDFFNFYSKKHYSEYGWMSLDYFSNLITCLWTYHILYYWYNKYNYVSNSLYGLKSIFFL